MIINSAQLPAKIRHYYQTKYHKDKNFDINTIQGETHPGTVKRLFLVVAKDMLIVWGWVHNKWVIFNERNVNVDVL